MPLDGFLIGFAFLAGAVSFFSPCSVGLFPAYVGYFLGSDPATTRRGEGSANPIPSRIDAAWSRLWDGVRLGGLAASGFFLLFLGIGVLVSQLGTAFLGPSLRWISIGIGLAIVALALLSLAGRFPTLAVKLPFRPSRGPASLFTFGIAYGLASLGCTLPVFVATALAALTAGGASGAFLVLLAYGGGMGLVMIAATATLALFEEATRTYVRRFVPYVQRASAALMAVAGAVVVFFYAVVWR